MKNKLQKIISAITDIKTVGILLLSFITGGYSFGVWQSNQQCEIKVGNVLNDCKLGMFKYESEILDLKTRIKQLEIDIYVNQKKAMKFERYANMLEAQQFIQTTPTAYKAVTHYIEAKKKFEEVK